MSLDAPPEFEVAGDRYRFEGMPAQAETRITRRLAPLIAEAVALVLAPGSQLALRPDVDVVSVARAAFSAWGRLSDDDLDVIERATLGALSRDVGGEWHSVWPRGEPEPAFPDIDGAKMQILVGRVIGVVVMRWVAGNGDSVPAEFPGVLSKLH
ncbi:hypothetical protein MKK84_27910 [Methylobacterium sp. E-065]|uniref:phage tail assembly chaperone n=1 Tax=Methylobacterium sp. E-065 TaxID=2836583 RepID=UPI001FBA995C|nr:hypothetical protein [Methylobacterium sp. E-065]MCJ2021197.1 hypothetical protein [Methylobacterium sp. E-065]